MQPLEDGDYNLYELAEDAPQIVGIVDERPEEVKALEVFRGSKWKIVQDENGIEDIKVTEERTNKSRDVSDERFREFDIVSPVFSDRNRGENAGKVQKKGKINVSDEDSDASPPRKSRGTNSDESPPRKKGSKISSTSDILRRPEERVSRKRDSSPSIRGSRVTGNKNEIDSDDSDISPPRKSNSRSIHNEHERKYSRCNSDSDMSPPRARRKKEDSDESPPRKTSAKCKQDEVFSKKSRFNQDSDESPPRKYRSRDGSDSLRRKPEPPRSKSRVDSDSDESPPRKFPSKGDFDQYHQTSKYHQYSDRPTRKEPINSKRKTEKMFQQGRSDSDEPPLQKKGIVKERLPVNALKYDNRMGKDSSSKKNEKQERTLEGKKAGLQDAKALRMENLEHQLKEKEVFAKMSDDLSGRNAATVMRDRATGKKRDLAREAAEKAVEKEKEDKKKEKYSRWGKGLKQVEDQQSRLHEDLYEMSKPLARYADDQDLESYLKEQEREGDPMQEYIRSQKLKKEKENPSLGGETKKYPVYQGPQPPPNRFGIRPGYRWDGVDRSTGFEQKWFQEQSSRKALQEESYKWSTEDM